ncbi:hypothetical protein ACO1O0_006344 [Amphichorda felina]
MSRRNSEKPQRYDPDPSQHKIEGAGLSTIIEDKSTGSGDLESREFQENTMKFMQQLSQSGLFSFALAKEITEKEIEQKRQKEPDTETKESSFEITPKESDK